MVIASNGLLQFWGILLCNSGDFYLQLRPFSLCNKQFDETAGDRYLRNLDKIEQMHLLGVEGVSAWKKGADWRSYARNWGGYEDATSRLTDNIFNVGPPKPDIISLRGAYSHAYEQKLLDMDSFLRGNGIVSSEHALNRAVGHIASGRIPSREAIVSAYNAGKEYIEPSGSFARILNGVTVHISAKTGRLKSVIPRAEPKDSWREK